MDRYIYGLCLYVAKASILENMCSRIEHKANTHRPVAVKTAKAEMLLQSDYYHYIIYVVLTMIHKVVHITLYLLKN